MKIEVVTLFPRMIVAALESASSAGHRPRLMSVATEDPRLHAPTRIARSMIVPTGAVRAW